MGRHYYILALQIMLRHPSGPPKLIVQNDIYLGKLKSNRLGNLLDLCRKSTPYLVYHIRKRP